MDLQLGTILAVILSVVGGTLGGWFLGSRSVGEWRTRFEARDDEARELDSRCRQTDTELATQRERASHATALAAELAAVRGDRDVLQSQQAALKARAEGSFEAHREQGTRLDAVTAELIAIRAERDALQARQAATEVQTEHFEEQKRLLLAAQETLRKEFEAAGSKVLESAQETFLKRAQDRFLESEKTSAERLRTLLEPVGQRLKSYEDQVTALEAKRVDSFGQLTGLIEAMRTGQEQVRSEAARLGNSLRNAPKMRGRWGELALRNVLEHCGLAEHTDFITEHSIETDEGRLRPDAIIRVPGNKVLVIDAKVSLNAYQDAFEAADEASRKVALDAHLRSMKGHITTLASKSYQSQFPEAPDYVLMFVPGEHFIAAAMEQDSDLWDFAFRNRVLLVSQSNLVALARTVAQVWRQDGLATEAREIGRLGGELYDRLAVTAEHMKRVGSGLSSAVDHYNKFVGSFERNVLSAGRRLREKHIEIGKREIEDVPLIESAPRYGDTAAAVVVLEGP